MFEARSVTMCVGSEKNYLAEGNRFTRHQRKCRGKQLSIENM